MALSVGVMPMVRSDRASSGVIFTLDTESGFRDVVTVSASYGLGEFVVQGVVTPDEWMVFKPTLARPSSDHQPALWDRRKCAWSTPRVRGPRAAKPTPADGPARFSLRDDDVLTLARWACLIEKHYSQLAGHPKPMDIEWAKDGITGELFVVQARPETVHSAKPRTATAEVYRLKGTGGSPLVVGQAVGEKIGAGRVRVVRDVAELGAVQDGRRAGRPEDRSGLGAGDATGGRDRHRPRRPHRARGDRLARVRNAVHRRHRQCDAVLTTATR